MILIEANNTQGNEMRNLTEVQKLQKELDQMMSKFNATKKANTIDCGGPVSKRGSHTYHNGVCIRSIA